MSDAYSSYLRAIEFVESFIPASGFERWRLMLDRFGNPHEAFRSVHVAGTSGKGSVAMMVGEILRSSGLSVGVHVKPYVQSATENLIVDGLYASCQEYAGLIEKAKPLLAASGADVARFGPVTWSEVTKLLPFLYFADKKVDFGVVEAGVGGREDLTNVLRPEVSVITSVGMDHAELLGGTIDLIAHQKAGIIKKGIPAVTGVRQKSALEVIASEAKERRARLSTLGKDFTVRLREVSIDGTKFDYQSRRRRMEGVEVRMTGRHQAMNAAVAIAAIEELEERGFRLDEGAIREGLRIARLPGRFEVVQKSPLVVLDVAHNVQKASVMMRVLEEVFPERKVVFVVGFLEGKDARRMVRMLARKARRFIFTSPSVRGKKPIDPSILKSIAERTTSVPAAVRHDAPAAVEEALAVAGEKGVVCVSGSLYLVGKVRGKWYDDRTVAEARTSFPVPA